MYVHAPLLKLFEVVIFGVYLCNLADLINPSFTSYTVVRSQLLPS